MQNLKALFIPTLNSGVTYWRMYNPVLAATRTGTFGAHLLWWQKGLNQNHPWQNDLRTPNIRARIFGEMDVAARQSDVIVMGVVHTDAGLTTMCGIRECYNKPVVVELDDNVLSCPTYNPAAQFYDPGSSLRRVAVSQLREADAVIVSTPYLKEIYNEFNDNVYILLNSMDFELWGKAQRRKNRGKLTIGWVGGASHNDDLKILEPAINYLTVKYPHVEFSFGHAIHPDFLNKPKVNFFRKFARIDKYPSYIARMGFNIGIAPLVDNAFNRAKSNLRWLEYSALGIPTVASKVGHFAETIKDGEDGLLCNDPEDFTRKLEYLINTKSERTELARNAYARVYRDFNINTNAVKYAEVLNEIVNRGQIKRAMPVYKDSNFKQVAEICHE